jgi:hypothetical protein
MIATSTFGCKLFESTCQEYPTHIPDIILPNGKVDSSFSINFNDLIGRYGISDFDEAEIIDKDTATKYNLYLGKIGYDFYHYLVIDSHEKGVNVPFQITVRSYPGVSCDERQVTFKAVIPEIN